MPQSPNGTFSEEQPTTSVRDLIAGYLIYWPLFLICLFISVSAGILYTYYAVPKYMAVTTFLVKGTDGGKPQSEDLIEAALTGKTDFNINNEVLLVRSFSLLKRTVARNNFNISYFLIGRLHNTDIYNNGPFTLTAQQLTDSNSVHSLYLTELTVKGGNVFYGVKKSGNPYPFQWNKPVTVNGQKFLLTPKPGAVYGNGEYIARWSPVAFTASDLASEFGVKQFDLKTSAILLTLKTGNYQYGKDVLDAVIAEFNRFDIEGRNKVSSSTVNFITERLNNITTELKAVEGNLESYQGSRQIVDIKAQSGQALDNASDASKTIQEISVQQRVTGMLSDYFSNPSNNGKLVPTSLGVNDGTLNNLLTQYNALQLRKEREAPDLAPNSTVMQDLNTQSANLKSSILENLNNISRNLSVQQSNFQQQNNQFRSVLSSVPRNTRAMQEIERKQSITEGLYLYLFQKREEAAISSTASNVAHYIQVDPATGYGPVEPNKMNIILCSVLLGLFVALVSIYIKNVLNDKIISKEGITRHTSLALLGQIAHVPKRRRQAISVLERNTTGEEFRAIRTNLSFLMKDKGKKVVMVTSSVSNEGKSFISLNLAGVFAMPGKKVALLEFDIRQPAIASNLQITSEKGITDYLNGSVTDLSELFVVVGDIPTLHVYPCGNIPLNPADLLLTDNVNRMFEKLKSQYDYVIVDSPPAGLVSDAFVLGAYTDFVLYVIRNEKTTKKQLDFISEVAANKTLNNVSLILNDVKRGESYGYGGGYEYNGYNNRIKKKKERYSAV